MVQDAPAPESTAPTSHATAVPVPNQQHPTSETTKTTEKDKDKDKEKEKEKEKEKDTVSIEVRLATMAEEVPIVGEETLQELTASYTGSESTQVHHHPSGQGCVAAQHPNSGQRNTGA